MDTANELASAVAGGIPFLIQPPIPAISLSEGDLRHLLGLFRFAGGPTPSARSRAAVAAMYYPATRELVLRTWLEDENSVVQTTPLDHTSAAWLYNDGGELIATGVVTVDPVGSQYQALTFQVALAMSSIYRVRMRIAWEGGSFERDISFSVTR